MAQTLRIISFFWKPRVQAANCRFASRLTSKTRMGHANVGAKGWDDDMSAGDLDDVEDKLEALLDEGRKRQKAVKYHILRRQMTASGAPQRMLTWDAIEQIRYLKNQEPEEWTVKRLAEGFSVTPDVISRILRSKFIPPSDRRTKQDAKVALKIGQRVLPSGGAAQEEKKKLSGNNTEAILPSGNQGTALVPTSGQSKMIQIKDSRSLPTGPIHPTALTRQVSPGISKDATNEKSKTEDIVLTRWTEMDEEEQSWDGLVLTEKELEEYLEMEKPSPVVQVGKDFFDAEGNFLYRI